MFFSPFLTRLLQNVDDVVRRFKEALCAASVIIVCLTPTYITRPNCLRELRWALDFAASSKKRVVLLPLHPAVTYAGIQKMMQPGINHGLVFSSKEKSVMRIKAAALELLSHVKFKTQMTDADKVPCHELQVPVHKRCDRLFLLRLLTTFACAGVEKRRAARGLGAAAGCGYRAGRKSDGSPARSRRHC